MSHKKPKRNSIKTYDSTAHYIYALMQPISSDFTFTRRKEDNFKAQQVSFYTIQRRQWLRWVSHSKNIHLQLQYN